jgi:hypothetical protein
MTREVIPSRIRLPEFISKAGIVGRMPTMPIPNGQHVYKTGLSFGFTYPKRADELKKTVILLLSLSCGFKEFILAIGYKSKSGNLVFKRVAFFRFFLFCRSVPESNSVHRWFSLHLFTSEI